jgi:hypothetical protein
MGWMNIILETGALSSGPKHTQLNSWFPFHYYLKELPGGKRLLELS